jgi:hypothetical protein
LNESKGDLFIHFGAGEFEDVLGGIVQSHGFPRLYGHSLSGLRKSGHLSLRGRTHPNTKGEQSARSSNGRHESEFHNIGLS